jgi:hypothetical protein
VAPSTVSRTGTTVTIYNDEQRSLVALEADGTVPTLPVTFGDGDAQEAVVRIIEWRSGKHRAVYFGPDGDHFPYEESGSDFESQFAYSAYVTWPGLVPDDTELGLRDMAPGDVGALWAVVRRTIQEHFAARRRRRRREQVEQWKESGVYPYQGEPVSEPERAERAVFDVVSGTLVQHIPRSSKDARLTLALLRDAIQHDPDKLTTILHEVVSLSEADRDTLTGLLSETTLSAIIRSANLVTSRHKFLAGLEHLLFDPNDSDDVGERDHLHKILEHELWVFGEGYHLMSSERGLTELLRNHLKLEGLSDKGVTPSSAGTARAAELTCTSLRGTKSTTASGTSSSNSRRRTSSPAVMRSTRSRTTLTPSSRTRRSPATRQPGTSSSSSLTLTISFDAESSARTERSGSTSLRRRNSTARSYGPMCAGGVM